MNTSQSFSFRLTVEEMVVEAYERCGKDPNTLTQYDAETARRSLNLLFSEWSVRGINYWTLTETQILMKQGQVSYEMEEGLLDVFTAVLRRESTDTVMQRFSISDYHELPNKTAQGRPSSYFIDRQYTPIVYVWNAPENSTDTFIYWGVKQIEDVINANSDADVPYRWTEAVCSGLAAKLSVKKAPERLEVLVPLAETSFDHAASDEREKASLRIVVG